MNTKLQYSALLELPSIFIQLHCACVVFELTLSPEMTAKHRIECPEFHEIISKGTAKSEAWEYFGFPADENGKIVSELVSVCKLCQGPVSSKSTSNLWSHLKCHHPSLYYKHNPRNENSHLAKILSDDPEKPSEPKTSTENSNSNSMKQEAPPVKAKVTETSEAESEVSMDNSTPPPPMHHLVVFNDGTTQVVPAKRLRTENYSSTEQSPQQKAVSDNTNDLFLRSLLPDMCKLNPVKLRHFKTYVITKLTHLLDEQDAEAVTRNPYVVDSCSIES